MYSRIRRNTASGNSVKFLRHAFRRNEWNTKKTAADSGMEMNEIFMKWEKKKVSMSS